MKAIQLSRYGDPDVLEIHDVSIAKPGPGQASVDIKAIGVNFIDIYQRRGIYPGKLP